jgi:hypothetical protein
MATIRVDSNTLQEHFDDSCEVKVTGFSWSKYGGGVSDVETELEVGEDLHYEDDDYIEIEEYNELKDNLREMTDEYQESQDELVTVQAEVALLKVELEVTKNKLVLAALELSKIVPVKKPWYKI